MAFITVQQDAELQCKSCLHQQVCVLSSVLATAQKAVSSVIDADLPQMNELKEKGLDEFILPVQVKCKHFHQKPTYGACRAAEEAAQCSS